MAIDAGAEDVTEIAAEASESGSPEIMVCRVLSLGVRPANSNPISVMPDKNASESAGYAGFQGFGAHVA